MHVAKTSFNGNPNIGLYAFATDDYCIVGREVQKKSIRLIEKVLKVKVYQMNLCGTSLIGVFAVANKKCLLVPDIILESEKEQLEKLKIPFKIIKTKLTALGNNIIANDKVAIVNPNFSAEEKSEIGKALGVTVKTGRIAGLEIVGSLAVHTEKGCLLHRDAEEFELNFIKDNLKVDCETGTVNMGNPYVKSGIITNNNGFLIGDQSGGPEIALVDEALGFL
ncbi:translation initiation factor IF-6 [Candidatus Woesearchaeota archaeon]|nr:MAG: translation initiation factor IF-6 [Candidatus Woesearchaeota archaeon]